MLRAFLQTAVPPLERRVATEHLQSMGRSCDAEHFVYRDVYGAVTRLRELRIGAAVVWERRDLLVTARFKQSGCESEVSLLDLMLQFGSENLVKELANFGVTVLQP